MFIQSHDSYNSIELMQEDKQTNGTEQRTQKYVETGYLIKTAPQSDVERIISQIALENWLTIQGKIKLDTTLLPYAKGIQNEFYRDSKCILQSTKVIENTDYLYEPDGKLGK